MSAEDNPAAVGQPKPTKNDQPFIVDLVTSDIEMVYPDTDVSRAIVKDLHDRAEVGFKKYKTKLQAFNGRDALMDLYQELLDASKYLRQVIEERPDDRDLTRHYSNVLNLVFDVKRKMMT